MKIATKLFAFAFIICSLTATANAQMRPGQGTVGLTASLQSGQTNLQMPIWVSPTLSIAPILGVNHQADSFTTVNVGVTPRFYQDMGDHFASFIGARGVLRHTSPEVGSTDDDLLLGATGGGQYFPTSHFSLGVEGQLNFLINDNGNNSIATGAAISGTYYF